MSVSARTQSLLKLTAEHPATRARAPRIEPTTKPLTFMIFSPPAVVGVGGVTEPVATIASEVVLERIVVVEVPHETSRNQRANQQHQYPLESRWNDARLEILEVVHRL